MVITSVTLAFMALKIAAGGSVIAGTEKLVEGFYDGKLLKGKKGKGGRPHERTHRSARERRDDSGSTQNIEF
ncbi:hypothetical protein [Aneurinibacillus danicus]|uniref:Uncharacterized protein n=1 Tax=Aneurinibacillus danicus TaxID=267746 RepID=A0A511VEE1_9BACL|nr:hypothetical protein [Aneurinibacillus danicus]GEN35933.1 hypothetical protein ADA01nite_33930 [Aneurinibacillus danicus]